MRCSRKYPSVFIRPVFFLGCPQLRGPMAAAQLGSRYPLLCLLRSAYRCYRSPGTASMDAGG